MYRERLTNGGCRTAQLVDNGTKKGCLHFMPSLIRKTFVPCRQGRVISGALGYAVDRINNCSCLLPDVELEFVYVDTEGKEDKGTEAVVDLICE